MNEDAERQKLIDAMIADPEGFHKRVVDDIIAKKGQQWYDEHKAEIEADWEAMKAQVGL